MVLHDISMWFSSKEPVLDKTISRVNRCNGDKLASLEEALRNDNSLYQSGYFWCVDHILFFWVTTSSNLANMTDPSVMSLSVVQFLKHTQLTEWWMREDRPLLRKIQIFVWYDQRQGGGVVLLQLSRLSIVILMNWLRDSCSATQSWTVEILQIGLSLNA